MIIPEYFVGRVYGRLTIKKFAKKVNYHYYFECECECGNTKVICLDSLRSGATRSCGCLQHEIAREHTPQDKGVIDGTNIYSLQRGIQKNNRTGVKGVCYDTTKGKYHAYIGVKGKQHKLGYFDTLEEATLARKEAEKMYHKPILDKYNKTK